MNSFYAALYLLVRAKIPLRPHIHGIGFVYLPKRDFIRRQVERRPGPSLPEYREFHMSTASLGENCLTPKRLFLTSYYGTLYSIGHVQRVTMGILLISQRRSHQVTVRLARCNPHFYASSFFSRTSLLFNSLPISCFSDKSDLQAFKFNVNRYLLST